MVKYQPVFGNGGAPRGRRITDDTPDAFEKRGETPDEHERKAKKGRMISYGGAALAGAGMIGAHRARSINGTALSNAGILGGSGVAIGGQAYAEHHRQKAKEKRLKNIERALADRKQDVGKGLGSALRRTGRAAFDDSAYYRKPPVTGKAKPFDSGHHNPADVPGRARHTKYESKYTTRYGGKERPKTNSELARSGVDPFGKSRFYDPESRRQRRLGMYEAGLAGGAVAGLGLGGKGIVRTSRLARKMPGVVSEKNQDAQALRAALRHGVAARRKDVALAAGGTASGIGAVALNRHAESRRGRPMN